MFWFKKSSDLSKKYEKLWANYEAGKILDLTIQNLNNPYSCSHERYLNILDHLIDEFHSFQIRKAEIISLLESIEKNEPDKIEYEVDVQEQAYDPAGGSCEYYLGSETRTEDNPRKKVYQKVLAKLKT